VPDDEDAESPDFGSPEDDARAFESPEDGARESACPGFDSPEDDSPEDESRDFDSPELESPDDDPPDFESAELESPDVPWPAAAFRVEAPADRRSFLAQPLPLNRIVGGANARMTGPSHSGHWRGPASLRPRSTSNRWPQEVQT